MNTEAGVGTAPINPPESASGVLKDIQMALLALDPKQDSQWTGDGQPRMDVVERAVGDASITRNDVDMAWPGFNRVIAGMRAAAASVADATDPPPSTGPAPELSDPAHQPPGPMISASDVKKREAELAERMAQQRVAAEHRERMGEEARDFVRSGKPIVAPTKDGNFIAYLPSKIVYDLVATPHDGFAYGDTPEAAVAILEAKQNS